MDDEKKDNQEIEENTQEDEAYNYVKDHSKPIRVLAHETREKRKKAKVKEEETVETPKDEPKPEPTPPIPETLPVDEEKEAIKRELDELKKQTAELKKINDSKLSEEQKEVKRENLRAKWSAVDETGKPTPKDYDEIVAESNRIAEERFNQLYEERRTREIDEANRRTEAQKAEQAELERNQQAYREQVDKMVRDEVTEMRQQGILKTPVNPNDPNDPALVEERDLFQRAMEVNAERAKNNQPYIVSISRIFYNHYKPSNKQPAGADAPVSSPRTVNPPKQSDEDRYIYARDSKKSIRDFARDLLRGK
ncbi:MAG: hypothetical protein ACREQ5_08075 [Candidatus Dormibacteria bacterium]